MLDVKVHRLTIMPPQPTQNAYRGYTNRVNKVADTQPTSVRWTFSDRKFIEQQAGKLGVTFGEFVRWCSFFCAVEVNKLDFLESFQLALPDEHPNKKKEEPNYDDYE